MRKGKERVEKEGKQRGQKGGRLAWIGDDLDGWEKMGGWRMIACEMVMRSYKVDTYPTRNFFMLRTLEKFSVTKWLVCENNRGMKNYTNISSPYWQSLMTNGLLAR